MKRILHISKYYFPFRGGTEQIAQDCVDALRDQYEQKVICFNEGKEDRRDTVDGIEVIRAGVNATVASQGLSASYRKLLADVMLQFQPDIIVFHYPNPFVARYLLWLIPAGCRLVIYWHLDIVKQKFLKRFFAGQNRRLVERADVLIATSPNYVDGSPWLRSAREKCAVVPNCINEKRLAVTPEAEAFAGRIRADNPGKILCVAVGRHTAYKGFDCLIRAVHLLDDRYQVYILGEGEESERLKVEAGDDIKIHFPGRVGDDVLKGSLLASDIFCFPSVSRNEAFGVALAEGMYFGKPAVTFTIPGSGVNYVCPDGETGIEVENRNIEAYAAAIQKLGEDEDLRRRMGEAGRKRVGENFLNRQFRENIRSVFSPLGSSPRSSPRGSGLSGEKGTKGQNYQEF